MTAKKVPVKIKMLSDAARKPERKTEEAAGWDVYACLDNGSSMTLGAWDRAVIPTKVAVQLPKGYEMQIRPRSGLAKNHGVTVLNSPATVDSDYRGEVGILLMNLSGSPFLIRDGDRIAQFVVKSHEDVDFIPVAELDDSERGTGGYGSTGV